MITIRITGRKATKTKTELITSGSVGMRVHFEFDSEWDNLGKIACFSGTEDRDQLPEDNTCVIPWECLQHSGRPVIVGVYGADGEGKIVNDVAAVGIAGILQGIGAMGGR